MNSEDQALGSMGVTWGDYHNNHDGTFTDDAMVGGIAYVFLCAHESRSFASLRMTI
jgi:hypothetical protein